MKNLEIGKDAIKKELPVIPKLPGIYRMLNEKEIHRLKLNIHKNGHEYFVEFNNGIATHPLKKIGKSEKNGSIVNFWVIFNYSVTPFLLIRIFMNRIINRFGRGKVRHSLYLDESVYKRISEIAKKHKSSKNSIMEFLMVKSLQKRHEPQPDQWMTGGVEYQSGRI